MSEQQNAHVLAWREWLGGIVFTATASDLQHTRLGCGECSRFVADPLLWKCG